VLRLELFTDRAFTVGAGIAFVFFGTLTSLIFTIALTLQFGFGFTPLRAGVMTLPWALGTGLAALASAAVYRRIVNLVLPAGMALFSISLVVLAAQLQHEGTDPQFWALAGPLLVGGAGLGLFVAPLQTAILATVDPRKAGSVSGLLPTVQQVGSSIGLAVIGVVFFNLVAAQSVDAVQAERPALSATLSETGVPASVIPRAEETFVRCATEQLGSTSPMKVPDECRNLGAGRGELDSASREIAHSAVVAAQQSTRNAAGEAFLQAERRILWIIAAVAAAIGVASTFLPRRNTTAAAESASGDRTGPQLGHTDSDLLEK
ncbi:MAG: MFS transporter, partial [Rhodococcus sp. (in: high G+C Gram-positive bacteria)]|uniref:MFS transporter n=1 Tax=Rhodococcus sp. TaxID=1831 RepID=UPI003BAEBE02